MAEHGYTIERLTRPASSTDIAALARVLVDAVQSGAAVSFLDTVTQAEAEAWWRSTILASPQRATFLVARGPEGIVGTVQVQPAWAPNQPHRGEICKLMVHRDARRSGVGARLMAAADDAARATGITLLTLDAKGGGAAERLYRRLGWTCVGSIPGYALDPDARALHDTVIFYKLVR
jgi:GNAT superfamily N-acetyltransferase